jgi:TPR repeat protein
MSTAGASAAARRSKLRFWGGLSSALSAVALVAGGCRAPAPASPEAPKAGVPTIEYEFLTSQYRMGEDPCERTAEEVVDMQRRCSEPRWADCVYSATMYSLGCGVAQNLALAEQLYRRGCSYGSMLGCAMAARLTEDQDQALALLEAPCVRGYLSACEQIGAALFYRGREADVARAAQSLAASCNDSPGYCVLFAQLVIKWQLSDKYRDAQTRLERGCQSKTETSDDEQQRLEACRLLASSLDQGQLGVTDSDRAMAIYTAACAGNNLASCDARGHMLVLGRGHEKDELAGAKVFDAACAMAYGPACDSMGQAMEYGWGSPADPVKAMQYYALGCQLRSEAACQRARDLEGRK